MKKELLILIIAALIFITACTGSKNLVGSGPDGVQIKFVQPEDIIALNIQEETTTVPIEVELTNYAECNIIGTLCVKDTLSDSFGGINDQCREISLDESRVNNKKIELDKQTYFFSSQPYSNLFKDESTNILATAKYSCNIITGPRGVCTKSIYNKEDPKCNAVEVISGNALSSKVAPVTVTKIEKKLLPINTQDTRLEVAITLGKMNKGKVSAETENQESSLKGNPIKIEVDYAGSFMSCQGKDYKEGTLYWKSNENEKIINCDIFLNSGDYQENPINIRLNYMYEITETKPITIKDKKEGS